MSKNEGRIKQVLGAVIDVSFEEKLPQTRDGFSKLQNMSSE